MIKFEKQTWYDKNDTENQAKRIPINATNLNRIENGIEGAYVSINELEENINATIRPIAPYLTFVGNTNADMVAAAFGKGNEDEVTGIGKALKMYANFKGNTDNVDFLDGYDKYTDLVADHKQKLIGNKVIYTLIKGNAYAKDIIANTNSGLPDIVLYDAGSTEYLDLANATCSGYSSSTMNNRITRSIDVTNGLINLVGNVNGAGFTGAIQGYACLCTIPLIQPLPELRGYRYIHVKFADNIESSIKFDPEGEDKCDDSCHIIVAGAKHVIGHYNYNAVLTGQSFSSNDFFDTYANNPSAQDIKIGIYLEQLASTRHYGVINIKKIWLSET